MITGTCIWLNICFTYLMISNQIDIFNITKKDKEIKQRANKAYKNAFIYSVIFAIVTQAVVYLLKLAL